MNKPNLKTTDSAGVMPQQTGAANPAAMSSPANPFPCQPAGPQPAAVAWGANGSRPVPLAYTVEETAAALNICTKTVRRLLARGLLTSSKVLRKKLIPRSQVENFLKATCDVPRTIK